MQYTAVLFDLDGTLVDSIPDIAAAANGVLSDLSRAPLPEDVIRSFVGKGSDVLVQRLLRHTSENEHIDPAEYERAKASFAHHYAQSNGQHSTIYPGVLEGLQAFKAAGCKLAVVTNKPIEFTIPLLDALHLSPYFELMVGGNTTERKKPHPLPFIHASNTLNVPAAQCLVIGDSINDAQAARGAQMDVLLVPYGYNEGIDIQTLDADAIVSSIKHAAEWATTRSSITD